MGPEGTHVWQRQPQTEPAAGMQVHPTVPNLQGETGQAVATHKRPHLGDTEQGDPSRWKSYHADGWGGHLEPTPRA